MGCPIAVEQVNGLCRGGEGCFQEWPIGSLALDAPRGVHHDQIHLIEQEVVDPNMGSDNARSVWQVVVKRSHVGVEYIERFLVGFNKDNACCTQQQGANAQDAIAGSKVNDHFPFEAVQLVNGQHPIRCEVAFCSVLLEEDVGAWMGR